MATSPLPVTNAMVLASERQRVALVGQGLIAETLPRQVANFGAAVLIDGTVYYTGIGLAAGDVVTNLSAVVAAAGVAVSKAKLGLYSKAGVLLAQSAAITTAWESTGMKTHAMTAPYVVPTSDIYYVAVFAKAGVLPVIAAAVAYAAAAALGATAVGAGSLPFGSQTGQADLPAPGTIAAGTLPGTHWVGIS